MKKLILLVVFTLPLMAHNCLRLGTGGRVSPLRVLVCGLKTGSGRLQGLTTTRGSSSLGTRQILSLWIRLARFSEHLQKI